ncbi:hypothetical protein [Ralstonia pickettii]|uniref:hypothetical protein n=1 Tax=Ralstonia pickettii TaxID=329 RepID=UPI000818BA7B|nr:hypothetical protein [Ralstonia pickettii]OCS49689.1 hypothetical protein BEK67_17740 [Ralstonia pickettii]
MQAGAVACTLGIAMQERPTASWPYIQARQLGGDVPPIPGTTAAQTLMAAAALPAVTAMTTLQALTRGLPQGVLSAL